MRKPGPVGARRRFVKLAAAGWVAVPLAGALCGARALAAEALSESDSKAVELKYRIDASRSSDRTDPSAVCDNCTLYTGKPGAPTGTCELFGGKLVAAKGWCKAWEGF